MAPMIGALLLDGCGGGSPPAKSPTPVAAPATPTAGAPQPLPVRPLGPEARPALPPLAYDGKSRRDPFLPIALLAETKGFNVAGAKLVGVVRGRKDTLALVEGADGVGYILKSGEILGNGRVTGITATTVTFAVPAQPGQGPTMVTLRLALD